MSGFNLFTLIVPLIVSHILYTFLSNSSLSSRPFLLDVETKIGVLMLLLSYWEITSKLIELFISILIFLSIVAFTMYFIHAFLPLYDESVLSGIVNSNGICFSFFYYNIFVISYLLNIHKRIVLKKLQKILEKENI